MSTLQLQSVGCRDFLRSSSSSSSSSSSFPSFIRATPVVQSASPNHSPARLMMRRRMRRMLSVCGNWTVAGRSCSAAAPPVRCGFPLEVRDLWNNGCFLFVVDTSVGVGRRGWVGDQLLWVWARGCTGTRRRNIRLHEQKIMFVFTPVVAEKQLQTAPLNRKCFRTL